MNLKDILDTLKYMLKYIKEYIGPISSVTNIIIFIIISILCIVVYVLKELNNSSEDIVKNLLDKCYYISLAVISICFILIPLVIRIIEIGITIYYKFKNMKNMKNSIFNFNNIISNSKKDSGAIDKTFIENIINGLVSVALNYLHIFITLIGLVLVYNFIGESHFFNVSLMTLMVIILGLFVLYVASNIFNLQNKSVKNLLRLISILIIVLSILTVVYNIFFYIVNLTTKFNKFVKEYNWWIIFSYIFTILVMILISAIVIIFNYFKLESGTILGNIQDKIKVGEDRFLNNLDKNKIVKESYNVLKTSLTFLDDI